MTTKNIDPAFIKLKPITELEEVTTLEPGWLLFDNGDGTLKRMSTDNFYQILNSFAKPISPTDPSPTTVGWYKPTVSSESPGTNYPNAGNLKAIKGFDTLFYYNGTAWTKTEVELPGVTAEQVFDPSDNANPSTMKAAADYIAKPENIGAVKVGSGNGKVTPTLNFIFDGYIDGQGNEIPYPSHKTTDFIQVPAGFTTVLVDEAPTFTLALYDAAHNFIKTVGGNLPGVEYKKIFDIAPNIAYVRYIHAVNSLSTASLSYIQSNYILPWLKSEVVSKLAGKKITWIGTSIPAGYPKNDMQDTWAYPNIIAIRNKALIDNKSVPSGVIRKALSNGGSMGSIDVLSFTNMASAVNYQNAILDKMGTQEEPDIVVIDYGVNDYVVDRTDIDNYASFDMANENLNTFIGAFNFVIKKILQTKPGIKLYIISHYSNSSKTTSITNWNNLNNAIVKIGQYWQIPTLQLFNNTGWIIKNGVDVLSIACPDGIHPASKTDTSSVLRLADIIEGFLLSH